MIAHERAAEIVRSGISNSASTYREWTEGLSLLDSGCENLLVATVARRLAAENRRRGVGALSLEVSLGSIRKQMSILKVGRISPKIRSTKRADIVLWSANGKPYGIIEIKRTQQLKGWREDILELIGIVRAYGHAPINGIKFGTFGAFLFNKGKSNSDRAVAKIEKMVDSMQSDDIKLQLKICPKKHWDASNRNSDYIYRVLSVTVAKSD